jgi:hypothetical protein
VCRRVCVCLSDVYCALFVVIVVVGKSLFRSFELCGGLLLRALKGRQKFLLVPQHLAGSERRRRRRRRRGGGGGGGAGLQWPNLLCLRDEFRRLRLELCVQPLVILLPAEHPCLSVCGLERRSSAGPCLCWRAQSEQHCAPREWLGCPLTGRDPRVEGRDLCVSMSF